MMPHPERNSEPVLGDATGLALFESLVRASAGATEHLPIARVTNLAAFLETVKSHGFWVMGTDASGGHSLFASDLTDPLALVIGGEEQGLRHLTKSRCDLIVHIPSCGRVASLNASAAAAVCLFEVARQRSRTLCQNPLSRGPLRP